MPCGFFRIQSRAAWRRLWSASLMSDLVSRHDIVNCYRFVLARDPESVEVVEEKIAQQKTSLLTDFFSSPEFVERIVRGIKEGRPRLTAHRNVPDDELRKWAADFLPLRDNTIDIIRTAETWTAVHHALFNDDVFIDAVFGDARPAFVATFVPALAERLVLEVAKRVEGQVELITPHEIRGWIVDPARPERRLVVELWIDNRFRAAVTADRYRPELQARFGGSGIFGFVITRPIEPRGCGAVGAELREAASGAVVAAIELPPVGSPPVDTAVGLHRELKEVRDLLTRIERRLPDLQQSYSVALDLYNDYFLTYYAAAHASLAQGVPLTRLAVFVDARAATPIELRAALDTLARQTRTPGSVVVVYPSGDLRIAFEEALARWNGCFSDPQSPRAIVENDWAAAMEAAANTTSTAHFLLVDARTRLSVDACALFDAALGEGAAAVYADSDQIGVRADGAVERHHSPAFRTSFDAELFLQTGDLGPALGLSRSFIDAVGWHPAEGASGSYELLLRGLAHSERDGFRHIPRVLAHGSEVPGRASVDNHQQALERYLRRDRPDAHASWHRDALRPDCPASVRVRYPLLAQTRATVVVPTRDRLDLLEPCLTSLIATAQHNRTRFEIVVVDNQSREPETFAFIERLAQIHPVRLLSYDGAFNWASMNNRAAAQTDADVLVFLNNDTSVLSQDWCDELCSQATRRDVGAVGARLLHRDGTIQHAGVVVGGWHAFAAHEGAGVPATEAGYADRHVLLREVSAVTGACLTVRRSVFEDIGGFDGLNLPVESNDVDFCLRVRDAGLKVLYDPYCTFYHYESKSRGLNVDHRRWAQAEAAGLLMRARWGEAFSDPFYNPHFDRVSAPLSRLRPPSADFR